MVLLIGEIMARGVVVRRIVSLNRRRIIASRSVGRLAICEVGDEHS